MGMYNEVRKNCPACGATAEVHIGQVVSGFGDFHLDYPKDGSFKGLDQDQKDIFAFYVNQAEFYCNHNKCENRFIVNVCSDQNAIETIYI